MIITHIPKLIHDNYTHTKTLKDVSHKHIIFLIYKDQKLLNTKIDTKVHKLHERKDEHENFGNSKPNWMNLGVK